MSISRRLFLKGGAIAANAAWCSWQGDSILGHGLSKVWAHEGGSNQIALPRVEEMPNLPRPYSLRDWKQVAVDLDNYLFDLDAKGAYLPLIWIDRAHVNCDEDMFGLYMTVDDPRCGPKENNGEYHDADCDLPAVIGATLVGIDKTRMGGHNWVSMCKGYFNKTNGRNVFMVNAREFSAKVGDGFGVDFWADTLPSMLFAKLVYLYPHEPHLGELMRICADQFYKAALILKDDPKGFHHQSFNFATMRPYDGPAGRRWVEPESSAAFAWLEYMAYMKFQDPKYLHAATLSMDALNAETTNPMYACILPFGAYLSARMNAEQGCSFDTERIVNWCLSGGSRCIGGVSAARWGEYDISGLVTMYDDRPYLFETFELSSNLVPLVRYDQRFARAIGKWMLNAANSARLFYPDEIPDDYQAAPHLKAVSRNVIGYEVLLGREGKHLLPSEIPLFQQRAGVPFVASRDPWQSWSPETGQQYVFPEVSHFSVYSSTSVGIFGAIISSTEHEKILRLDCLKTDYFHDRAYPTYLYFNPYDTDKVIEIDVGNRAVDLYDTVSKRWLGENVQRTARVILKRDSAIVVVHVPAGAIRKRVKNRLFADGIVIDYRA